MLGGDRPADADPRRLQALGGGSDDEDVGLVDILDMSQCTDRRVMEQLVGLVDQQPAVGRTGGGHQRIDVGTGARDAGRIARVTQHHHRSIVCTRRYVVFDRWAETVFDIAFDQVVGHRESLEDVVIGGVLGRGDLDADVLFEKQQHRHQSRSTTGEHHDVIGIDGSAVVLAVVTGDSLTQSRHSPRLGVKAVGGGDFDGARHLRSARDLLGSRIALTPGVGAGLSHRLAKDRLKGVEGLVNSHRRHRPEKGWTASARDIDATGIGNGRLDIGHNTPRSCHSHRSEVDIDWRTPFRMGCRATYCHRRSRRGTAIKPRIVESALALFPGLALGSASIGFLE